jgi:hypothetical protein
MVTVVTMNCESMQIHVIFAIVNFCKYSFAMNRRLLVLDIPLLILDIIEV